MTAAGLTVDLPVLRWPPSGKTVGGSTNERQPCPRFSKGQEKAKNVTFSPRECERSVQGCISAYFNILENVRASDLDKLNVKCSDT